MKREIKFQFDYNCAPIWLIGEGDWLISSEGYFVGDVYSLDGKPLDTREPEDRLKGEVELEQKVKLIYEIYCRLFDINEFPAGEPYIGFEDEQEKKDFFDACNYVIKRMKEIFGEDFSVHEYDERLVNKRSLGCKNI
ncbi:MAG: hypothetical protein K2N38_03845 [Oscillospiraceae bacterium]|nr:hypothetical protein [Oscillospiraceae bacterium]